MTVPSPFEPADDSEDSHLLLVGKAGQHSRWPAFAAIPDGWSVHPDHPDHPEGEPR
jgi:uncharacterized protein YbdZ (MbtH family)